jgi:hypothetical protein
MVKVTMLRRIINMYLGAGGSHDNYEIDLVYVKLNVDFYKYLNVGKIQNRKSSIYKEIINLK